MPAGLVRVRAPLFLSNGVVECLSRNILRLFFGISFCKFLCVLFGVTLFCFIFLFLVVFWLRFFIRIDRAAYESIIIRPLTCILQLIATVARTGAQEAVDIIIGRAIRRVGV